jgi:deferrochelatase/peroxidase EfeB
VESTPQDGIYFEKGSTPGKSFGIIFLRTVPGSSALEVGNSLSRLWKVISDWRLQPSHAYSYNTAGAYMQNLSSLLGFGPRLFDLRGIRRSRPKGLISGTSFLTPSKIGGGQIFKDSGIFYDESVVTNDLEENEVAIQYVGDNEAQINTAIVETYRILAEESLTPTKFYTGFRRPNERNWLGFHDGLSNVPRKYRKQAIFIDDPSIENKWTNSGCYMSFMRIIINIQDWWRTSLRDQEIIIGREKLTGCPIKGVDRYGNIIRDPSCPIIGTKDVTEKGNEKYRESTLVDYNYSKLNLSHLSTMKPTNDPIQKNQITVFRQGYEFLESEQRAPGFRVGLNFVSFQNDPSHLFKIMTEWKNKSPKTVMYDEMAPLLNRFITVICGGIFFVPPISYHEEFPGSSIFIDPIHKSAYRR